MDEWYSDDWSDNNAGSDSYNTPTDTGSFNTGAGSGFDSGNWGGSSTNNNYNSFDNYGSDYDNLSSIFNTGNSTGGGFNLSDPSYNYSGTGSVTPASWGTSVGGSISSVLQDLFTKGSTANNIGKVGAALLSGYQNSQKASNAQKIASQIDPWQSQRSFYQTQAQNAVTDPMSSPIVANQIAQLQAVQDRKDAAAGRRSNSLLGSTAVMGEAAKIAQAYQQQMANQGGANIQPSGLANVLQTGSNASTDGYISPLSQLFGYNTQSNTNSDAINALTKFLSGS